METDDFLAHYGVKGMKWGKRKTPEQRLAKVNRKIDRIDGNRAFQGYMLRAHFTGKMAKKELKKNPNWDYRKLSDAEDARFNAKADAKARRVILRNGATAAAIIAAGAAYTTTQMKLSPQNARGAQIAFGILALKTLGPTVTEMREINSVSKLNRLQRERAKLEGR